MRGKVELGWRQLCLKNAERRDPAQFRSLDLEREVSDVLASLSREELSGFDVDEFRDFLGGPNPSPSPVPRFEETLRLELWWKMVQSLISGGGIPQA